MQVNKNDWNIKLYRNYLSNQINPLITQRYKWRLCNNVEFEQVE